MPSGVCESEHRVPLHSNEVPGTWSKTVGPWSPEESNCSLHYQEKSSLLPLKHRLKSQFEEKQGLLVKVWLL